MHREFIYIPCDNGYYNCLDSVPSTRNKQRGGYDDDWYYLCFYWYCSEYNYW